MHSTVIALRVRQDASARNRSFPRGNRVDLWSTETVTATRTLPEAQTIISLFRQVSTPKGEQQEDTTSKISYVPIKVEMMLYLQSTVSSKSSHSSPKGS